MPYVIIWENKGIRWKFHGVVTSAESAESNLAIYSDPRFDTIRYQIADFSGATDVSFLEKDMKKIAYLDQAAGRSNPRIKVALVASDQKIRSLLEAYIKHSQGSPWETRLFDAVEFAEQWLSAELALQIG